MDSQPPCTPPNTSTASLPGGPPVPSQQPASVASAPPAIRARLDPGSNTTAPGIAETGSSVSEAAGPARLSSVPSHDNSSHSGSEKAVERMNPFEQLTATASTSSSVGGRPPLEQVASHHSASPDRPPSSPLASQLGQAGAPSPSSRNMHRPFDGHETTVPGGGAAFSHGPQMPMEEDDFTHSSSAVNSTEPASSYTPSTENNPQDNRSSFSRLWENTRRRMTSNSRQASMADEDDLVEDLDGRIIGGYLQKLGRNGKWQTRWFESDGECLSYYKNENRTKLLATLDLEKVGEINLDPSDDNECSFTIQVLGRLYHLRAQNKVTCTDWVITLIRIKEAKMNQGNVKLVGGGYQAPPDLLDQTDLGVAPRVVVVSNRGRTRAVAETQDFDQIMRENAAGASSELDTAGGKRLSTIGTVVLARWNKRRSSFSRLRSKLAKWARSLRNMSCTSDAAAGLDNHVHPPGHDDARKKKHLGWTVKETPVAAPDAPSTEDYQPRAVGRKMSSASEDIRVLS